VEEKIVLNSKEITEYLPHRYPFLLVDAIISFKQGEGITGIKNVTVNEWFFQGHFPEEPIFPGVLILEAMAQVGIIFAKMSDPSLMDKLVVFAGLDGVRFRRQVLPGDQMLLELNHDKRKGPIWKMSGVAKVNGNVACEAQLIAAVAK